MGEDRSGMGGGPVLVEQDPLPCTEGGAALPDRDGEGGRGEGGADVCRHVVGTFGGVAEERVALRNQPVEEALQVAQHLRIGVLLDQQRGGGVLDVEGEEAGLDAGAPRPTLDLPGDLVEPPPFRLDGDLAGRLPHRERASLFFHFAFSGVSPAGGSLRTTEPISFPRWRMIWTASPSFTASASRTTSSDGSFRVMLYPRLKLWSGLKRFSW